MVLCLLCFDDSPIENDPKQGREGMFKISMMDTLTTNQPVCCLSYMLPCCCAYKLRKDILDGDMTRYTCCQGYLDCMCFRAGECGEKQCPDLCLCFEAFLCVGPSVSASRLYVSDIYDLRPDPCDNRIVRFTNCMLMLSCVCDILSIFNRDLRHLTHVLHSFVNMVYYCTIGCMTSQTHYEMSQRQQNSNVYSPLVSETLQTATVISSSSSAPPSYYMDERDKYRS